MGEQEDRAHLEAAFPGLVGTTYRIASPCRCDYNCVAFAAGDTSRRWWPHPSRYWPSGCPREPTVGAFIATFQHVGGYGPCTDGTFLPGCEKLAIYADAAGVPTHVARQKGARWHSKLGDAWDILHDLGALEGEQYGRVVGFLARSTRPARNKAKRRRRVRGGPR
ncbi:MAG: hypothetical protein HY744_20185 [Deltaproteobacteria bacterium]|nr:hypothetical protein [Deltaproteobacteria bacterium]